MGKKIAILQSNYIPWKGYFDLIASVDEFILYDDVQYTHSDWRNRNKIKTPQGEHWLSVPIKRLGGKYFKGKIKEAEIEGTKWRSLHWKTLIQNYRKANYFDEIAKWVEPVYLDVECSNLSFLNRNFIERTCNYLGINTTISNSWDYELVGDKTERLVNLCTQAGGGEYISGPSAKNYIIEDVFTASNIKLSWIDYSGYPEYPQLYGGFVHAVSILDLLFNCGKKAHQYMKHID